VNIVILTDFERFSSGYSLCGIVQDQIDMLQKYGHSVRVLVSTECEDIAEVPHVIPLIPPLPSPQDYPSTDTISPEHSDYAVRLSNILRTTLNDADVVFTHDWIHTGWHLPYAEALRSSSFREATRHIAFLHWVHSIPTEGLDWWTPRRYGKNHVIVYENETDRALVSDQFNCDMSRVRVIPPIRDLRTYCEFHEDTSAFIEDYPGLMQADIVQVYPASRDRLKAKGLHHLIALFGELKRRGRSVCLVIADQLATGRRKPENIQRYRAQAEQQGLRVNELVFTSEVMQWDRSVPRRNLRELQMLGNLFVNPTNAESFGLTLAEMALMSAALPVHNSSLPMSREVSGGHGLFLPFGSYCQEWKPKQPKAFYEQAVNLILARMRENDGVRLKTFVRQSYNADRIYRDYYEPIMNEVRILRAGNTQELRA